MCAVIIRTRVASSFDCNQDQTGWEIENDFDDGNKHGNETSFFGFCRHEQVHEKGKGWDWKQKPSDNQCKDNGIHENFVALGVLYTIAQHPLE
jgi:hypothetical protein